jgi:hypothetical protein
MLFLTVAVQGAGVHTDAIFAKIRASTATAAVLDGVGVPAAAGDAVPASGVRLPQLPATPQSLRVLCDLSVALLFGVMPTSSALTAPNSVLVSLHTLPLPDWNLPLPLLRGSHENEVLGVTNA